MDLWVITDDLRGLLCVSVDNSCLPFQLHSVDGSGAVQGQVFQNQARALAQAVKRWERSVVECVELISGVALQCRDECHPRGLDR